MAHGYVSHNQRVYNMIQKFRERRACHGLLCCDDVDRVQQLTCLNHRVATARDNLVNFEIHAAPSMILQLMVFPCFLQHLLTPNRNMSMWTSMIKDSQESSPDFLVLALMSLGCESNLCPANVTLPRWWVCRLSLYANACGRSNVSNLQTLPLLGSLNLHAPSRNLYETFGTTLINHSWSLSPAGWFRSTYRFGRLVATLPKFQAVHLGISKSSLRPTKTQNLIHNMVTVVSNSDQIVGFKSWINLLMDQFWARIYDPLVN